MIFRIPIVTELLDRIRTWPSRLVRGWLGSLAGQIRTAYDDSPSGYYRSHESPEQREKRFKAYFDHHARDMQVRFRLIARLCGKCPLKAEKEYGITA